MQKVGRETTTIQCSKLGVRREGNQGEIQATMSSTPDAGGGGDSIPSIVSAIEPRV